MKEATKATNEDVVVMDDGEFYNHMRQLEEEAIKQANKELKEEGVEVPEE